MSRPLMPKSGAMAPYIVVNRDAAVAGVFSVDGEAGAVVLTSKYLQISKYNLDKQELNTRLTGIDTRLTGIDTRIDGIDTSIGSINESVGNINTALGGINTSIEGINTSIEGINTSIEDINTTLGEVDTSLEAKASKGANNDITSLSGLTTALSITQGGTGATTATGARSNLGLGTAALKNTGVSGDVVPLLNADNTWSGVQTLSTPLAVASGGTGVSSLAALFTALNIFGRVVGVTQLVASGTWTPSATAKSAFVFLQAGGGAGGGAASPSSGTSSAGSGGNSGSGALIYIPTLAASYNCVVGSGGARVAGNNGGSGGDTSFGDLCSVVGGGGGSVLTSGGNTAVGPGAQREDYTEPTLFRTGPGFGTAVFVFGTSGRQAGHGADSSLGRGGRSGANGRDGGGFGSGGGGAESTPGNPARPGGNGAGGCVLIIELS